MKIAIAGFGLEGRSSYAYFRSKYPASEIVIFDENEVVGNLPEDSKTVIGRDAFAHIIGFDLVVRTAGLPPRKIGQSDHHWSATREFFNECPAPIIGVTGSKGKGTTCSFIVEILRAHFRDGGQLVHLVGNIGVPALEILADIQPNDIVVYELSSFQLWDIEQSPTIAVITLLEPDHLDVHTDMSEYVEAKSRIFKYQHSGDVAVYNEQDDLTNHIVNNTIQSTGAAGIPFLNKKFVHIEQDKFCYSDQEICPVGVVDLPGRHNLLNAAAAISATWQLIDGNTEAISSGLKNFHGLPHRLGLIRTINDIKFYDDSIATTPGSAIAAIRSFNAPIILILGGHDKGADYTELGRAINESTVKKIYAIGANRDKVNSQIRSVSTVAIENLDTQSMIDIVDAVYNTAMPGDTVILSPAAASFDMFTSYKDRGDQFIAAVKGLC